jgi:hypothetical protein
MKKKPEKGINEKVLQRALLRRAPSAIADLSLFPRDAHVGDTPRVFGAPGQADLWGVWQGAIHIEIELKSVDGRLSKEQKAWKEFCLKNGIPHLVLQAWTGETVPDTIDRWIQRIISCRPVNGVITLQIGPRPPPVQKPSRDRKTRLEESWPWALSRRNCKVQLCHRSRKASNRYGGTEVASLR